MQISGLNKFFPLAIIVALVVFSIFIIKDLFVALLSAFILAFMMHPLYKKFNKRMHKTISATLCVIIIILIVIIPLVLIAGTAITQLSESINTPTITEAISSLADLPIISNFHLPIKDIAQRAVVLIINFLQSTLSRIPQMAVTILVIIFGTYYFLVDWEKITSKLKYYIPTKDKEKLSKEISIATKNIIYGTLLIALIEFIFAGLAFWLLGIKFAFVYATLIAIFAFIPGLGPIIVWVPLAIYFAVKSLLVKAALVTVIGIILSFYIDSILRAQISGKKANIHPFLMLVGIIGGITVFGIFGFIIGPIILVVTIQILEDIVKERNL